MPLAARPRVVLADDHAAMLEKIGELLDSNFDVVAEVADGEAAVRAITELLPEIAVLDIGMPVLNGLDAARQLRRSGNDVRIVFLTMHEDPDYILAVRELGASYVPKALMASDLVPAINKTLAGGSWISSPREMHLSARVQRTSAIPF